jgi:DNA-binding NarL/FixJ family response regulator
LKQIAHGRGARCLSDALRTLAQRQGSGAKIPRHRMRGTVLLLESDRSLLVDVDLLRANELIVYHCRELANALKQFQHTAPDVVVVVLSGQDSPAMVPALRDLSDHATSIIVASVPEEREAARQAGADSFLVNSAPPADLLYEIRRALILRRSGRRLPWNW